MIRVLVVDAQHTICQMLRFSLEPQADLEIVDIAMDSDTAQHQVKTLQPDVALIGLGLTNKDSLATTQMLCQHTKVLILGFNNKGQYTEKALQSGAKGYLLKTTPPEQLAQAIRSIHQGYFQLEPGLFEVLAQDLNKDNKAHQISFTQDAAFEDEESPQILTKTSRLKEPSLWQEPFLTDSHPALAVREPSPLVENEWAEATQIQINSLPRVWTRGLVYFLTLFIAIALPWAMLTKVDEIGTAKGRLEPQGKTVRLDAPVAGTVSEVKVREGETIKQGQNLMVLESELTETDLLQTQAKLEGQLNRLTQLKAMKNQLEIAVSTQRLRNNAQTAEQVARLSQIKDRLVFNQKSSKLAKDLLEKDNHTVKTLRALQKQGAVSGVQVDQAERTKISNQERFQQAQSNINQAQTEMEAHQKGQQRFQREGDLAVIEGSRRIKEIQAQITDLQAEIAQTQNQIKSLRLQLKQRIVRSPINGTIFQLPIQHAGAVVQPSQLVAQLAPQESRMILRAKMPSQDSGFLRVGLPVKLKFDAYPFQTYGIVPGRLTWISPDSKASPTTMGQTTTTGQTSSNSNNQQNSFELEIELSQSYIQAANRKIILKPGQTATAEVIVRQRRLIDYLIDPFRKLQQGGLEL